MDFLPSPFLAVVSGYYPVFTALLGFALAAAGVFLFHRAARQAAMQDPMAEAMRAAGGHLLMLERDGQGDLSIATSGSATGFSTLAELRDMLGADFDAPFRDLAEQGVRFAADLNDGRGRVHRVTGMPVGGRIALHVVDISDISRQLDELRGQARATIAHRDRLDVALRAAPILIWAEDAMGELLWSNAEGQVVIGRLSELRGKCTRAEATSRQGGTRRFRVSIHSVTEQPAQWYDVLRITGENGETVSYALAVDQVVRAEEALSRFVDTLTETFAHLPIGLAIFDRNRELGLFNPALSDLLSLDPAWMAGRPSLRAVLDRLRESGHIPDHRDYLTWRERLMTLERDAENGQYDEAWLLPSGRTLRVTGRPHPQGAVAFLFEDITPQITVEQRYRERLEQRHAALDRIEAPLALFDGNGVAAFMNAAASAALGPAVPGTPLDDVIAMWRERIGPSPAWERLRFYSTGPSSRREVETLRIEGINGGDRGMRLAPLPAGGTLAMFDDEGQSGMQNDTRVETPLPALARQILSDSTALRLATGVVLEPPKPGSGPGAAFVPAVLSRRAGYMLALSAVGCAEPGAVLRLGVDADDAGLCIAVEGPMRTLDPHLEPFPLPLLRRIAAEAGGSVTVEPDAEGGTRMLSVTLPCALRRDASPGRAAEMTDMAGGRGDAVLKLVNRPA